MKTFGLCVKCGLLAEGLTCRACERDAERGAALAEALATGRLVMTGGVLGPPKKKQP